jgi:hypothetical protein
VYDIYGNNSSYRTPIELTGLSAVNGNKNMILKIYGDNLTQLRRVWFNNVNTTDFYRISNTEYSVIVPSSTTGPLVVEDIFGILSRPILFTYQTPVIQSLSVTTGSAGDTLVLYGIYLSKTTRVYFGEISATLLSVRESSITVQVPVGVGIVTLRIYDSVLNQTTSSQAFQYQIQATPIGRVQAIVKSSTANASQKYYSLLEGTNYSIAKYVNASTYNRLYNSSNPITGITYLNNKIYFCDPSANAIRSIPFTGGSATTLFTRSTMVTEAVKTNGSTLFIACRNTGIASNDALITANLSGNVLTSQPYSAIPGYTLKGITYKNNDQESASDAASIALYGTQAQNILTSLHNASDALAQANFYLSLRAYPQSLFKSITFELTNPEIDNADRDDLLNVFMGLPLDITNLPANMTGGRVQGLPVSGSFQVAAVNAIGTGSFASVTLQQDCN